MFRSSTRRVPPLLAAAAAMALTLLGTTFTMPPAAEATQAAPARPQGPCDVYAAGGTPCVAAHSTTRAMYASYNGPLYQVRRLSDNAVRDIGIVQPVARPFADAGGYADAAAQDAFCADTTCFITVLYDQSPMHNDLTQAPRGGFSGPALGGFNNLPIADMAPITVGGHKAYGIFIEPGMGLRNNDTRGVAVDDQPQGQYWVINGQHYNSGCCYDYGNAEIDSRDDGNGTMETTYYGNATAWYRGSGAGPWIMTDQENNLVGCVNPGSTSKVCADLPSINWRFVTAMAKGEPHHWASLGGDAQQGPLSTMFDGPRINATYDPMRKQGAILLGNGGDNSNGSQGTFYEGAMTTGYPSDAVDQQIQDNVVAAKYDVQRLRIAPASAVSTPPGLQTFAPGSSQDTTVTFTNTTGSAAVGVKLSISLPDKQWTSVVPGTTDTSVTFEDPVAPGASVSATFKVTSGPAPFNGDLTGNAWWTSPTKGGRQSETTVEKVRNVSPIKINEFRTGSTGNSTNAYIELYNAGAADIDISNWTLTQHPAQQATFSTVTVPAGTTLPGHGFYLLGLANSGLAAPAAGGDTTVNVRSTTGLAAGHQIAVDTGAGAETRTIVSVGTAATGNTTLWQPLPDGPVVTIPAGSTNVPVTSVSGFTVGQKIGLGFGANHEVATVTAVGRQGTQGLLSADAHVGDTRIRMSSTANISVGDRIRLDIDSPGHGIEYVTVTAVGTSGANGTGITIAEPLRFEHASNLPYSVRGTGVSFTPASRFPHSSNEPVQALGSGITLDEPLANAHAVNAPVRDTAVANAGYPGTPAPHQWFGGPALASAGNMVLRDTQQLVVDSLNYGSLVDPWTAEGYQATSGAGQSGCRVSNPGTTGANGRSAARFPDGNDTDSNCGDFQTASGPTPGASNDVSFTLSPGPRVSLQTTAPSGSSNYLQHGSTTTSVVTGPVTAASPNADKQNATFVKAAGLANPSCFSFEAVNRPGNYLRHQGFVVSLQPDDGSTLFSQDATFCQVAGNNGRGASFQSVNFSTRYLRDYNGGVYLAGPPGTNEWDTSVSFADDTSWLVATPWAPAP